MRHLTFSQQPDYPICFLVPRIQGGEIQKHYLDPISLNQDHVLVLDLHLKGKKTSVREMRDYLKQQIIPTLWDMGVKYVLCSSADYFKLLTGAAKVDASLGYALPCVLDENFTVFFVPDHRTIFYDPPKITAKIKQALTAFKEHVEGRYRPPGSDVLHLEEYPESIREITQGLQWLLSMDQDLACDIEGFGLKHWAAGIGSISFSWTQGEGLAFLVDYEPLNTDTKPFGRNVRNEAVRKLLRDFFEAFAKTGRKLIFHNIAYDAYVLIYQLFMEHLCDTKGLLHGLSILLKNWDCTKLISYLATNSCAGNNLSLKDQAQEYAGNYAMGEEIKDILNIPPDMLLRYNLIDASACHYVRKKHWGTVVADQQETFYEEIFKPATLDVIQMQLTGLPVDMKRVLEVEQIVLKDQRAAEERMFSSPLVHSFNYLRLERYVETKNAGWKKKRITVTEVMEQLETDEDLADEISFNPGSAVQLQELIYDILGLPVLMTTKTGQPSTKAADLTDLKAHTEDPQILEFLDALLDWSSAAIIMETFIPALKGAQEYDGWHYLFGNFNLGGTISGRLSSSDPNLQNLPASSKYAKLIKSCIVAMLGWVFMGLDFASLEDRISALTTKDPNKLKVYTDGYDGHSLRAYAYYREQMPDIDASTVEGINEIQKKYKPLRDKSKNPTFTLTYQGTADTLVRKYKFTPELAATVEERYHELYKVSDDWVADRLLQAGKDGYITAAFGLRVRTPVLAQVIRGNRSTPREGEAEGRSAGNALGQSWCLLNSRAASEFMSKVRSGQYAEDIRPCAQIHDAQYYLVREDSEILAYCNEHLVKAVKWQDHPEIWHDEVKLGGEMGIFYPSWANEITIPNAADAAKIEEVIMDYINKQQAKG